MQNTWARVGVVAVLVALLSACASTPAPEAKLLVPSVERVGELQKLSEQSATVANLLMVTGQEKWLLLEHSDHAAFVGHAFDEVTAVKGMSDAPIESVPFNEIALVYYATPPHPFLSVVAPERASFPSLPTPGAVEQRASCADLDVELARAEAIRWYARNLGAVPFTAGEAAGKHAKNFAKGTAIALLVFVAIGGGGGNCCGPGGVATPKVLSEEDWRWVVTAADRRVLGLLELKQNKHCSARAVDGMEGGDLGALGGIHSVPPASAAGSADDKARMAQQTAWLDKLNPMPLAPPAPLVVANAPTLDPPGIYSGAVWVPGKSAYTVVASTDARRGTIELTDTAILWYLAPTKEVVSKYRYADVASVETREFIKARWIVITHIDGHVDSFWLTHGQTIDRERTEALGAMLKTKVSEKSGAGAGK